MQILPDHSHQAPSDTDTPGFEHPRALLPPGFVPEGVEVAIIDQHTLSLIDAIPGGREVFVHLLHYATLSPSTTMQQSLFQATGEGNDEAIVLAASVKALVKSPNSPFRSPDAYARRLLVLEALKILRRVFHRHYTEFRIPLGKRTLHVPFLLVELGQVHQKYDDEKVKQLARNVARRLKMGVFPASATTTCTVLDPQLALIQHVLDSILQARGLQEDPITLASACRTIASLLLPEKYGRADENMGAFLTRLSRTCSAAHTNMGKSVEDLAEKTIPQSILLEAPMGESVAGNSPISERKPKKRRTCRAKMGEFETLFVMDSPDFGLDGKVPAKTGDSIPDVSIIALSSEKNITKKEKTMITPSITEAGSASPSDEELEHGDHRPLEEIRREARFYESFFDHGRSRKWTGSLINVLRETPNEAKRLAAVGAVYYSYFSQPDGRTVYSPGGWFTSACRRYAQAGAAVPAEIRAWSETNLPLKEIRKRIKQGGRLPSQFAFPWEDRVSNEAPYDEHQEAGVPEEERTEGYHDVTNCEFVETVPPPGGSMKTWMDREMADALRERIVCEGAKYPLRALVRPGPSGRYGVRVTWPKDGVNVEIVNEEDWVDYFTAVRECLDEW